MLKDKKGKKRSGELNALEYLFEFLNAYDFSSEGGEAIQEDNKTLINASVLGLIFEKINGYKDGSFFTPGFITMYMCRETIRKAVVQKFNEAAPSPSGSPSPSNSPSPSGSPEGGGKARFKTLDDIYDQIDDDKMFTRQEANELINSLKICDPAVGSGHFLVSALNEMIAIKNDLNILQDRTGRRLKEYQVEVVNDELIVTDEDGELFEYNPASRESQRIQETLFNEKQKIIENCLFGVDINPNSVKICRLRLWIELLKNAYYKWEHGSSPFGGGREGDVGALETLPNIDINIKCGNSLISRFDLDADLSKALKDSKWNIDSYRAAVNTYRNAQNKEQKREMEKIIHDIKNDFRSEISSNDPKVKRLQKVRGELFLLTNQTQMFEMSKREKAAWNKKLKKFSTESKKLETEIREIKDNKIYENAFEWRFEFPEVLNEEGDYVGFDVVIGNPPYVQLQSIKEESKQYKKLDFQTYSSMGDLYALFYERGNQILRKNGILCFITGSAWMRTNYGQNLRTYINEQTSLVEIIDLSDCDIFDSATVLTSIVTLINSRIKNPIKAIRFTKKDQDKLPSLKYEIEKGHTLIDFFPETSWVIADQAIHNIKRKVEEKGKKIIEWEVTINRGILTGYNEAFIIDKDKRDKLISIDPKSAEILKPLLRGRDVKKYSYEFEDLWLIGTHNGTKENGTSPVRTEDYPAIKEYLDTHWSKISTRFDKGNTPYNLRNCAYWEDFEKPKIIYPNMTKFLPFSLDKDGNYLNDKCFIITGEKLYYLVAFLNSKLFRLCFSDSFPELQGNSKEIKKFILEQIPVKPINEEGPFIDKVSQIIDLKKGNPTADTSSLEAEIDRLVYELYGLTEEEIGIVEGSVN